jgi:putative colanic acid biosynthesis UDP-glucose lipid carrier transferase
MLIKRIFDLTFSTTLMIIGSPVFLLTMLITKLSSSGPIFYKSERIGMWGEKFKMYKFRSMYTNADDIAMRLLGGDMHSIGNDDPRITTWGKIMRKTRLDELPQFINVLKGEMSVVGPRPLPQYDVDMLIDASPLNTKKLLSVKPGVTSLGQVQFGYASTQQENVQRMTYDLLYLKKYSLRTDVWLIYLTARVMLQGKGK